LIEGEKNSEFPGKTWRPSLIVRFAGRRWEPARFAGLSQPRECQQTISEEKSPELYPNAWLGLSERLSQVPHLDVHGIGCKTIARVGSLGITKAYKIIFP
jgi:hypothetical protein